jgi:hypothetical protein
MAWQKVMKKRLDPNRVLIPFVPLLFFLCALLGPQFQAFLCSELDIAKAMQVDLRDVVIRVNSFVKTFVSVSQPMLYEHFVRGSGIACRELQPAADLVIPVYSAEGDIDQDPGVLSTPLNRENIYAAQVQVKRRIEPLSLFEVDTAFSKMRELHRDLAPNFSSEKKFPISLLLELPHTPLEAAPPAPAIIEWPQKKSRNSGESRYFEVDKVDGVYQIRALRLSVLDIDDKQSKAEDAFRRLLESTVDPRTITCIPENFRDLVTTVFDVQPYMEEPSDPVYKSSS